MNTIRKASPLLIGITGYKGAGKDTVANHLSDVYGFTSVAFADPVRAGAAAMFDVPVSVFTDVRSKETPMAALCGRSPRYVLQTLGTEWGRNLIRSDMWVEQMRHTLHKAYLLGNHRIVISDVRFDDEAQLVRELGGEVWLVTRPETPYTVNDSHQSEKSVSLELVSRLINNNMDKKTLYTQIGVNLSNVEKNILHRSDNGTSV